MAKSHPASRAALGAAKTETAAPAEPTVARPARLGFWQWRSAIFRSFVEFGKDRIAQAAAGVTFYSLLSLFPAISAFISLYGLVADAAQARTQVLRLRGVLPAGALEMLSGEITRLTASDHGTLGLAFAASLLVSIWSANNGVKALIDALNVAYGANETRGFFRLTLVSLAFTLAALVLAAAGLAATVVAPAVMGFLGIPEGSGLSPLRWPALLIAMLATLSFLYRYGPSRPRARWRWITAGGVVAAVGWILMSALFSWYVANFGHYDKTYGSLGAIVGFLTWVWLSLMVVLYGAELNAELEKQAAGAG